MSQQFIYILLIASPVLIGAIIAAINANGINNTTENIEAATRSRQQKASSSNSWVSKYIINPILYLIVQFCNWTDSFKHRGLKNGVRVAATLYLISAWLFILYAVFMIALMIAIAGVVIYIVFKVMANSNSNSDFKENFNKGKNVFNSNFQNSKDNATDYIGLRGSKTYSGSNWFNEDLTGRVDKEGNIYKGTNWFNEEKIGRIDDDGNIYEGANYFSEKKVGRIDDDGNINSGSNWFNERKTGRIDKDGNIHEGTNWFNEKKIGRSGN